MGSYSIKELEQLSGIKAHTIRIWEQRYNLLEPQRTEGNTRFYDDNDLKHLLNVAYLNKKGLKISKLTQLSKEEIKEALSQYSSIQETYPGYIDKLIQYALGYNEAGFQQIFSRAVMQLGFEETMTHVVYPLLEKIGVMWAMDKINPGQEHFVSNIIRQKLAIAIHDYVPSKGKKKSRCILFLPEGEYHDIGLLLGWYFVRANDFESLYLGQSLPFADLVDAQNSFQADFMITFFVHLKPQEELTKFIDRFTANFGNKKLIFGGSGAADFVPKKEQNVQRVFSVIELKDILGEIN